MLEHAAKSSGLCSKIRKLHVDFHAKSSIEWGMINLDEIDPRKARSGLFALVTARLEDAHELAIGGQNGKIDESEATKLLDGLVDQASQIEILLMAIRHIRE